MSDPLTIDIQGTPNPNAAKFTLNRLLTEQGVTYRDTQAAGPAWAKRLLGIAGVSQVFALKQFITVTKAPEANWEAIVPQVEQRLRQELA